MQTPCQTGLGNSAFEPRTGKKRGETARKSRFYRFGLSSRIFQGPSAVGRFAPAKLCHLERFAPGGGVICLAPIGGWSDLSHFLWGSGAIRPRRWSGQWHFGSYRTACAGFPKWVQVFNLHRNCDQRRAPQVENLRPLRNAELGGWHLFRGTFFIHETHRAGHLAMPGPEQPVIRDRGATARRVSADGDDCADRGVSFASRGVHQHVPRICLAPDPKVR